MQSVSLCDNCLYVPYARFSRSLIEVDNLFQAIGYLFHAKVASFLEYNILSVRDDLFLPSDPAFVDK